jgi:hypothetical protein
VGPAGISLSGAVNADDEPGGNPGQFFPYASAQIMFNVTSNDSVQFSFSDVVGPDFGHGASASVSLSPAGGGNVILGCGGYSGVHGCGSAGAATGGLQLPAGAYVLSINMTSSAFVGTAADARFTFALSEVPDSGSADGPLPLWALGAVGAGLIGIVSRKLGKTA